MNLGEAAGYEMSFVSLDVTFRVSLDSPDPFAADDSTVLWLFNEVEGFLVLEGSHFLFHGLLP